MEEIKEGEYIRTKDGIIAKLDYIEIRKVENIYYFDKTIYRRYDDDFDFLVSKNLFEYIVKHSPNIIDLIEDEDIVILEYKSPKYRERITRRFEVSKIDDDIRFENAHCNFHCKVGDKKILDKICKNIKIKGIVTIVSFESVKYEVQI